MGLDEWQEVSRRGYKKGSNHADVDRISSSIFVTNFPNSFTAKELFLTCKQYGHVVDSYIPVKKTMDRKRFGFVKFINVFNEERLVNNLCTIWNGRLKLHANVARFSRESKKVSNHLEQRRNVKYNRKAQDSQRNYEYTQSPVGITKSYANVVNGSMSPKESSKDIPMLVLDDSCLNQEDLSFSVVGKVKELSALSNLKVMLGKEGFDNFKIKYMGGQWVMFEFQDMNTKDKFKNNLTIMSWFSQLILAHHDFVIDERIMWVEIEGVPCKWWTRNTFVRIASRWGTLLNKEELKDGYHSSRLCISTKETKIIMEAFKMVNRGKVYWLRAVEVPGWVPDFEEEIDDDSDEDVSNKDEDAGDISESFKGGFDESDGEAISETVFEENPEHDKSDVNNLRREDKNKQDVVFSEDPFGIYDLLNNNKVQENKDDTSEGSCEHPPGFTPPDGDDVGTGKEHMSNDNSVTKEKVVVTEENKSARNESRATGQSSDSVSHKRFKKSTAAHITGGSIIHLIDELVKAGQTMGYDMTGCINNMERIIGSQGGDTVYK